MKTIITLKPETSRKEWILKNIVAILAPSPEFKNSVSEWPKVYSSNFIEPGLVSYEEQGLGKCFVSKDALDKMAASFVGKPVVDKSKHIDGMQPKDFEDVAAGIVTRVYWKPEDSWYWCDFILWDDKVKKQVTEEGYSVSCAYKVTESSDKGGVKNNIAYDQEVLNGEYTHLAIVPNPRYNGAKILINSITGGSMKIKAWLKRLSAELKNAISPEGSSIDVDGDKVPLKEIVSAYEEEEKEKGLKAKQEEEAKAAAAAKEAPKEEELGEDSTLTIGGKEVTIKDALNCYKNRKARKNAADAEAKKKADDEVAAKKAEEEKKNAEDADKKKKEEEAKAAADKKTADDKVAEEKKNALEAEEKQKKFLELKNKADNRGDMPMPACVEDKRAKGKELYGSENGGK